jgi:hypothetical protein
MNSPGLQTKLTSGKGRVAAWAGSKAPVEEVVREIYLSAYAREPDAEELGLAAKHLAREGVSREESVQDLVWTLINTAEFVFNH